MNNKLTKGFVLVISMVILLIMVGCAKQPEETIKVGAILSFTGDFSLQGQEVSRGIELAKEDAKKEGLNIEVIYEDDKSFDFTAAANAANKLVNIENIDVGITVFVEQARPVAQIFNERKIPLIVVWDSNQFIQESGEYLFSTGFSTEKAGEKMAEFAYKDLNLRRVATVSHIDAWAEIISEAFSKKFESLGGVVVYKEEHDPAEKDYRTTILKIKQVNLDGVYFPLIPINSINFLIQVQQLGLNTTLMTGDALIQEVIDRSGDAAEGVYLTNIFIDETEELTKKYLEKYNTEPRDITMVALGYEGINTIKKTLIRSDKLSEGLIQILGTSRTLDRMEKLYKVINGTMQRID